MELTLKEIAVAVAGCVVGDEAAAVRDVAPIEEATEGDITFISDRRHLKLLKSTGATAVILRESDSPPANGAIKNLILVKDPLLAFVRVMDIFRPQPPVVPGIHPKAEVSPKAAIGTDASIQAFAVVEEGAVIGDRTTLYPGVYIGRGARVGDDTVLHSGVRVREGCQIGSRVIIHCNSVVGSDGFGYARAGSRYEKIPQRGIVRIEDDVEVGACVTIDRATIGSTVIGRGTKIDNLVQIAHNVKVGTDSVIVAQAGIAGSTRIGNRVQVAGQAGIAGHIEIGDDSSLGAKAGATNDIPPRSVYSGFPAIPHKEWLRASVVYGKLPELKKKLEELEKRLSKLEKPQE
ncbi:MAG: UDP-3-O-(3-hydroxymyristoyl)glucosamine N-acyltransferase [Deltaproteobacteria bacterium]|nr:UDP-3-O-(3-hydroxymyristoyl)glucosamine N-acyltransferase [Deltaproteobacteria bacterium]